MTADNLKVGFGRRCINPESPLSLAGYFNQRMWTGVLDDIFVHVLAFKQGDTLSVIMQYDLVSAPYFMIEKIIERCAVFTGLNKSNMLICATHTHTAPQLSSMQSGENLEYVGLLLQRTEEAVRDAMNSFEVAEAYIGEAYDDRFAFNRRYWMKDGTVVTNPGKLNPEIDRPEGPIDPTIPMLGFKVDNQLKYLLTNISNHSDTTGGCEVSGDWPGVTRSRIEAYLGKDAKCIPLVGPAGNINTFDTQWDDPQNSREEALRIGEGYAESIIEKLEALKKLPDVTLKVDNISVTVGPHQLSEQEVTEAEATIAQYADIDTQAPGLTLTSEDLANKNPIVLKMFAERLIKTSQDQVPREFNLVAISLGQVAIMSLPGEPFVEIGLNIREKAFPGKALLITGLSSSGAKHLFGGYIPNAFNYGRGGYETTPASNPYARDTADKLLEGAIKLAKKLDK